MTVLVWFNFVSVSVCVCVHELITPLFADEESLWGFQPSIPGTWCWWAHSCLIFWFFWKMLLHGQWAVDFLYWNLPLFSFVEENHVGRQKFVRAECWFLPQHITGFLLFVLYNVKLLFQESSIYVQLPHQRQNNQTTKLELSWKDTNRCFVTSRDNRCFKSSHRCLIHGWSLCQLPQGEKQGTPWHKANT